MKKFSICLLCLAVLLSMNVALAENDTITLDDVWKDMKLSSVSAGSTTEIVTVSNQGTNGARTGRAGKGIVICTEGVGEVEEVLMLAVRPDGTLDTPTRDEDSDTYTFSTASVIVAVANKYTIETASNGDIYYRPVGVACAWKQYGDDTVTYITAKYAIKGYRFSYPRCLYESLSKPSSSESISVSVSKDAPTAGTKYSSTESPSYAISERHGCTSTLGVGVKINGVKKTFMVDMPQPSNLG